MNVEVTSKLATMAITRSSVPKNLWRVAFATRVSRLTLLWVSYIHSFYYFVEYLWNLYALSTNHRCTRKLCLFVATFEESAECICLGGFFIQTIFSSFSETYTCTRITLLARLSARWNESIWTAHFVLWCWKFSVNYLRIVIYPAVQNCSKLIAGKLIGTFCFIMTQIWTLNFDISLKALEGQPELSELCPETSSLVMCLHERSIVL